MKTGSFLIAFYGGKFDLFMSPKNIGIEKREVKKKHLSLRRFLGPVQVEVSCLAAGKDEQQPLPHLVCVNIVFQSPRFV